MYFPDGSAVKSPYAMQSAGQSPGSGDPFRRNEWPHSSILAPKEIPWTKKPGRLQYELTELNTTK